MGVGKKKILESEYSDIRIISVVQNEVGGGGGKLDVFKYGYVLCVGGKCLFLQCVIDKEE